MSTDDDMDKPVTKRELHEALGLWGGALEARLEAKLEAKLATKPDRADFEAFANAMNAKIDGWGEQLSTEIKQRHDALLDAMALIIGRIDAKYSDLPGRVANLEQRVGVLEAPRRRRR